MLDKKGDFGILIGGHGPFAPPKSAYVCSYSFIRSVVCRLAYSCILLKLKAVPKLKNSCLLAIQKYRAYL